MAWAARRLKVPNYDIRWTCAAWLNSDILLIKTSFSNRDRWMTTPRCAVATGRVT